VKTCHFEAKPRNLSFYVVENARSLTPFEMTNWRQDEFSHSCRRETSFFRMVFVVNLGEKISRFARNDNFINLRTKAAAFEVRKKGPSLPANPR